MPQIFRPYADTVAPAALFGLLLLPFAAIGPAVMPEAQISFITCA